MNRIIEIIFCFVILCLIYLEVRNEWVFKWQNKWVNAVCIYELYLLKNGSYDRNVDHYKEFIEPYEKSFKRFWDWNPDHMVRQDMLEELKQIKERLDENV